MALMVKKEALKERILQVQADEIAAFEEAHAEWVVADAAWLRLEADRIAWIRKELDIANLTKAEISTYGSETSVRVQLPTMPVRDWIGARPREPRRSAFVRDHTKALALIDLASRDEISVGTKDLSAYL